MSPIVENWSLSPRGIEAQVAWRETLRQVPAPSAIAKLSADVTIADATTTDVTWDTEVQDNGNFFAPPSKFLIPTEEGIYLVGATIKWSAGFAGRVFVRILHGAEIVAEHDDSTTGTTANSSTVTALIAAAKDDQIKVVVHQDATGTKDLEADSCRFWIVRVKAGL